MEKSDSNERQRNRNRGNNSVRMNAGERKKRLQHFREKLFAPVSERKARQGYAKLSSRKVGIEVGTNVFGEIGGLISFFRQCIKLATADFDDGKLAGDKEAV